VLFYLAPETNFALVDHPETELFLRLQHRSGAWETLAGRLRRWSSMPLISKVAPVAAIGWRRGFFG
jgi:hypothetical protein